MVRCPDCSHTPIDPGGTCPACGWSRYRPSAASLATASAPAVGTIAPPVPLPFFPVATHKFVVLCFCTIGVYELYWTYQNWKRVSARSPDEGISAIWRTVFCPFWGFSLFGRVEDRACYEGILTRWNAPVLATIYLVLHLTWRAPSPWDLLSMATFVPMIPVQVAMQRINHKHAGPGCEDRNAGYSGKNILGICLGAMILALAVAGQFFE